MQVNSKRIDKIRRLPFPTSLKEMQGLVGFLSSIQSFSNLHIHRVKAKLAELLKRGDIFSPTEEHKTAFDVVKRELSSSDFILSSPDPTGIKILYTDASKHCMGSILMDCKLKEECVFDPPKVDSLLSFHPQEPIGKINERFK